MSFYGGAWLTNVQFFNVALLGAAMAYVAVEDIDIYKGMNRVGENVLLKSRFRARREAEIWSSELHRWVSAYDNASDYAARILYTDAVMCSREVWYFFRQGAENGIHS
jgi:hypothetical protein